MLISVTTDSFDYECVSLLCFIVYTASFYLFLQGNHWKLHCHWVQVVDNEVLSFMGTRKSRKLEEVFPLVNYIRISNTAPYFFRAMCQASVRTYYSVISRAVESRYPCVLLHCPSAVSVLAESYKKNHWGRKRIKINVDHSLVSIFLY